MQKASVREEKDSAATEELRQRRTCDSKTKPIDPNRQN